MEMDISGIRVKDGEANESIPQNPHLGLAHSLTTIKKFAVHADFSLQPPLDPQNSPKRRTPYRLIPRVGNCA